MDCAGESGPIRREVERLDGVAAIAFDHARQRMVVEGDAPRDAVEAAVARTGLSAEPWTDREDDGRGILAISTAISGAALATAFAARAWSGNPIPFFAIGIVAGIWHVVPRALSAARHLRPDMHLLMCIAIGGAVGIGEWFEGTSVAFLYSLSLALEAWSVGRARRAVEGLLELAPATATLADDRSRVAADEVKPGTRILVRPGERVALDGVVREGESTLDESALTGESLPVDKAPGAEVFAGSINGAGALVVETTREAGDTTVAHMAELVERAGEKRSRSERWVERFARVYTPAVMVLALLVLVAPPLLFGASWSVWFYRALVLLVIACPCALVISTPVSIVAGLTSAARHGVLVKGGDHLETPARLRAIALDKTGTLTHGRPAVVEVVPLDGHTEAEILGRAAAVEARAEHPIARAVVAAAQARGLEPPPADSVKTHGGRGAEGLIDGRQFWVGSHRWLEELRADDTPASDRMTALAGPGRSVLFLGNERHVCGLVALEDGLRDDAKEHVKALHDAGLAVAMVTGDNRPTAEAVARATGVDEVHAELLPEQKVETIAALRERYGAIAMVGDGINDAPAMARADLGIAMGIAGADIAIEAADVALMKDDLSRIPWLVGHSRRTLGIIRQNITAALVVKALFVVLTFVGGASLWAAIAADMGVSLAVVFNALRLLRA
jgi:Cd2+/Zn2+-exporting ATPase